MATYTESQQRGLDIASGATLDRRATSQLRSLRLALKSAQQEYAASPSRECQAEIMRLKTIIASHPAQTRLGPAI